MTTKIKELKAELKQLSLDIRQAKIVYKNCQRNGNSFSDYSVWAKSKGLTYTSSYGHIFTMDVWQLSDKYRHMHIAYCLLRGRKYEQIENKVRDNNEPKWSRIESILAQYRDTEEIACAEVVNV